MLVKLLLPFNTLVFDAKLVEGNYYNNGEIRHIKNKL